MRAHQLWRPFERWLRALPPRLGALVDGVIFGAMLTPLLFRGRLATQAPLLLLVVLLLVYASYGLRVHVRRGVDADGEQRRVVGADREPPE